MKNALVLFFLLLVLQVNLIAHTESESLLGQKQETNSITSLSLGNEENILFWECPTGGDSQLPQFLIQKLNAYGDAVWAKDVRLTVRDTFIRSSHKLISDGQGGVIITWEQRTLKNEATDVYAQKVDSAGKVLWGQSGLKVSGAEGSQITPCIITDNLGGAIISWNDSRNDLTNNNWDIYAQHVNSAGQILWEKNGIVISADLKDEFLGKLLPSADGGATVIWNMVVPDIEGREGYDFYFQKISPTGIPLNAFLPNKFLTLPPGNTEYALGGDILGDGNDGFFINLAINTPISNSNIYLQHILSNGLSAYPGEVGIMVDTTSMQNIVSILPDSLGNLIVSISNQESSLNSFKTFDNLGNEVVQNPTLESSDVVEPLVIIPAHTKMVSAAEIKVAKQGSNKTGNQKPHTSFRPQDQAFSNLAIWTREEFEVATITNKYQYRLSYTGLTLLTRKRFNITTRGNIYSYPTVFYRRDEGGLVSNKQVFTKS